MTEQNAPHVEDCAEALSFWDRRRAADAAFYATPKHNIWQMLSRVQALMACLDRMERKMGADLSRFKVLAVGCATGYGLSPFLVTGFLSTQLFGVELFEDRLAIARNKLPGFTFYHADATDMKFAGGGMTWSASNSASVTSPAMRPSKRSAAK